MDVLVFDSPDSKVYRQSFSKNAGNDTLEFSISDEQMKKMKELCIAYHVDGLNEAFISFWPYDIC